MITFHLEVALKLGSITRAKRLHREQTVEKNACAESQSDSRGLIGQLSNNSIGSCANLKHVLEGAGDDFGTLRVELMTVKETFKEGGRRGDLGAQLRNLPHLVKRQIGSQARDGGRAPH
jgi:hypothetical protein